MHSAPTVVTPNNTRDSALSASLIIIIPTANPVTTSAGFAKDEHRPVANTAVAVRDDLVAGPSKSGLISPVRPLL